MVSVAALLIIAAVATVNAIDRFSLGSDAIIIGTPGGGFIDPECSPECIENPWSAQCAGECMNRYGPGGTLTDLLG